VLKVFPERFVRLLSKLHDILLEESDLMDWVNFFKKIFTKLFQDEIKPIARLISHFFARSLSENGMNLSLVASSPGWGILIIKHTYSNFLMKKYASFDSMPWNLKRVFMNYGFSLKLLPFTSGN